MKDEELKEMWKEMIDRLSYRILDGDIIIPEDRKYLSEAFVRPFFGDDDWAYGYLYDVLYNSAVVYNKRNKE